MSTLQLQPLWSQGKFDSYRQKLLYITQNHETPRKITCHVQRVIVRERKLDRALPRYAAQYKLSGISSGEVFPSCGVAKVRARGSSRLSSAKDRRTGPAPGVDEFLVVIVTRKQLKAYETSSKEAFGASEINANQVPVNSSDL